MKQVARQNLARVPGLLLQECTRDENKSRDNGCNHNPPQNSPIKTTTMTSTVATTTIMLINTKGSILQSLLLLRDLEFGNETFHFNCDINLGRCSIERAGCYGELWLRPLSQTLFSRVDALGLVGCAEGSLEREGDKRRELSGRVWSLCTPFLL